MMTRRRTLPLGRDAEMTAFGGGRFDYDHLRETGNAIGPFRDVLAFDDVQNQPHPHLTLTPIFKLIFQIRHQLKQLPWRAQNALTGGLASAAARKLDGASVIQLLLNPGPDEGDFIHAARRGQIPKRPQFSRCQRNGNGRPAREHPLTGLDQLVGEVRNVVAVPELGQLSNRVRLRQLHGFFQPA
jgi:hypothetical protein